MNFFDLMSNFFGLLPPSDGFELVQNILILMFGGWLVFFFFYEVFNFLYLMGKKIFY